MKKILMGIFATFLMQANFCDAFILTGVKNKTNFPVVVKCLSEGVLRQVIEFPPMSEASGDFFKPFNCQDIGRFPDYKFGEIALPCSRLQLEINGQCFQIWAGDEIQPSRASSPSLGCVAKEDARILPGIWICSDGRGVRLLALMCSITSGERRDKDSKFGLTIEEREKKYGHSNQNTRTDIDITLE